jgi:hypothetical protein
MNSDLVWLLALAAASMDRNSPEVTRMRSISPFALPFGNGGLPALGFFGCFKASVLLHDGCSYGINR